MEIVLSFVKIDAHLYLDTFGQPLWSAFPGIYSSGVGTFCFSLAVLLRVFPEGRRAGRAAPLPRQLVRLPCFTLWPRFKEQRNVGEAETEEAVASGEQIP